MTLTNKLDMPEPFVRAVTNTPYSGSEDRSKYPNWFSSVTGLINPPHQQALYNAHRAELEADVSGRWFAFRGSAKHAMLEWACQGTTDWIAERRLRLDLYGKTITGGIDLLWIDPTVYVDDRPTWVLSDLKNTSVYSVRNGTKLTEWATQLNIYAYMLPRNGLPKPDRLSILVDMNDWKRADARRDPEYPQHPWMQIPIAIWSDAEVEKYLLERIQLHADARAGRITDCSPEERWESEPQYRVLKPGADRSLRNLPTLAEAEKFKASHKDADKLEVHFKPGERKRCADYCDASPFCQSWQQHQKEIQS